MYGIGNPAPKSFVANDYWPEACRERGWFVQLYNALGTARYIRSAAHGNLVRGVRPPIAALIQDLKQRGHASMIRDRFGVVSLADA